MASKNGVEDKQMKVMVAIDESESSYYALMWVLQNLQESITKSCHPLILFTALPPPIRGNFLSVPLGSAHMLSNVSSPPTPELVNSVHERNLRVSNGILEKAERICASHGINAETITVVGNAKEAICDSVKKLKINLLVLGDHGTGNFKRVLLGSVSNYCVSNAKCPVLVVKKPAPRLA